MVILQNRRAQLVAMKEGEPALPTAAGSATKSKQARRGAGEKTGPDAGSARDAAKRIGNRLATWSNEMAQLTRRVAGRSEFAQLIIGAGMDGQRPVQLAAAAAHG